MKIEIMSRRLSSRRSREGNVGGGEGKGTVVTVDVHLSVGVRCG